MSKFFVQFDRGIPAYDFCYLTIEAVNFNTWYTGRHNHDIIKDYDGNPKNVIPVGSVEFVHDFVKKHYPNVELKPINIPEELMEIEYTRRNVFIGDETQVKPGLFVKSVTKVKGEYAGFVNTKVLPSDTYIISEPINIISEWRCFVYNGVLQDLRRYSGELDSFPDVDMINEMIGQYKSAPVAYTLDIGVLDTHRTVVIEVHDFYSCGLYGFSEGDKLLLMFSGWFKQNVINKA